MLFSPSPLQEFNIDDDNDALREKDKKRKRKQFFIIIRYYISRNHVMHCLLLP